METAKVISHASEHVHLFFSVCQKYRIVLLMFIKSDTSSSVLVRRPTDANLKQVKNLRAKHRKSICLSHDALYNSHELAHDLETFVHKMISFPDLTFICGLKTVLQELDHIISAVTKSPTLLSHDTTFQLGDFYVSPVLFHQVLFNENLVITAAFILHERKFQSAHEEFMKIINLKLPSLSKLKKPIPIVTDDDIGLCAAINKCLSGVYHLQCWNHLINSIKLWLQRHGATSEEISVAICSTFMPIIS